MNNPKREMESALISQIHDIQSRDGVLQANHWAKAHHSRIYVYSCHGSFCIDLVRGEIRLDEVRGWDSFEPLRLCAESIAEDYGHQLI